MKAIRGIKIPERLFTAEDLRRIASIFEKQEALADKSSHHASVEYAVRFSDETTRETDTAELFADDSLIAL